MAVDPERGPPKAVVGQDDMADEEAAAVEEDDVEDEEAVAVGPGDPPPNDDKVRGITSRDHTAWLLFRALARGDFHHDFGEGKPDRDKFMKEDENRFFEIAKRVSKSGAVELRTTFLNKYKGKTLYEIIKDEINMILPPSLGYDDAIPLKGQDIHDVGVADGQFAKEDALLQLIGLNWKGMKAAIVKEERGFEFTETFAETVIEGGRTYKIRACPYRLSLDRKDEANYKTPTAPIDALYTVSGGKKNFALIVDASGGLPLSELRDRSLIQSVERGGSGGGGSVYIIENIENGADSATKLLPPAIKPKGAAPADYLAPPELKFLRDKVNTVNYPLWANGSDDQKSNIYSSLFIILNRISEDNVEANLLVKDAAGNTEEAHSIGDIANTSNVKNASLYALATIIERGGVTYEALIYTLIKRMGDWCQALSLLDLDREYTVLNEDRKTPSAGGGQTGGLRTVTLRELQVDTEIGIVTNDRILLAFCILLGLNVFYTSGMDIARLIYFKNVRDLPQGPEALKLVNDLLKTIDEDELATIDARVQAHENAILAARDAFIEERIKGSDIADYILAFRSLLSNLGRLRLEFVQSLAQLKTSKGVVLNDKNQPLDRLSAANVLISVMSKVKLDIAYNESVLADLVDPANRSVDGKERIRLAALKQKLSLGIRIPKSVEVTESRDILLETRNDIRQILGKQPSLVIGQAGNELLVEAMLRTTPDAFGIAGDNRVIVNYTELLSAFPAIMILFGPAAGAQRGGALVDVDGAFDALGARAIRVLGDRDSEVTSTSNIYKLGATYYDEALNAYTVADEFIVTKDDLVVFERVFEGLDLRGMDGATSTKLKYICNRYLLLLLDNAWNDLDGMVQEYAESQDTDETGKAVDPGILEVGSTTRTRVNQIVQTVARINAVLAAKTAGDFIKGTLDLYSTPPLGETQPINSIGTVKERLNPVIASLSMPRTMLSMNIKTLYPAPAAERTETVAFEQVASTVLNTIKYGVFREQIAQRIAYSLGITKNDVTNQEEAAELGAMIENYISDATLGGYILGRYEGEDEADYVTGIVPRAIADAAVAAVQDWVAFRRPLGLRGIDGILANVRTYAKQTTLDLLRPRPAAPPVAAAPGQWGAPAFARRYGGGLEGGDETISNAGGSSSGGVRRKLYAGLRKRGGSGTPPSV
jgi:hypothetical protein